MRLVFTALCSVALGACSHATVPNDTRADAFTGAVTGVIVLPDSGANGLSCSQIDVFATTTDEKGATLRVGRPSVHQGQGRCSYEITDLPPAMALIVHVEAPAGVRCGNGASLAFSAQNQEAVSLKDSNEGQMRDFHPQCSATTSSL
jgi:hypothetical protein